VAVSLTCKVWSGGVEAEYPVTPKVEVEFERKFGVGIGKAFTEQKREHQQGSEDQADPEPAYQS